jgi:hypothetical protein
MDGTNTLPVETKVLCHALGNYHLKPKLSKVSNGKGIVIQVPSGETLVRCIKERKQATSTHNLRDLSPLVLGQIDTCWVVRAGMQHKD